MGAGPDDVKEVKVLNKVIRYTDAGIELEADPRHAEIILRELQLVGTKASTVPGAKADRQSGGRAKDKESRQKVENATAKAGASWQCGNGG